MPLILCLRKIAVKDDNTPVIPRKARNLVFSSVILDLIGDPVSLYLVFVASSSLLGGKDRPQDDSLNRSFAMYPQHQLS